MAELKIKTKGLYLFFAYVSFADNTNGIARGFAFAKNGTIDADEFFVAQDGLGRWRNSNLKFFDLNVDDYIELQAYQDSGGNLNIQRAFLAAFKVAD